MTLDDWYISYINTSGVVVTGSPYDGTHYLDFSPGISGSDYNGVYSMFPSNTSTCILSGGMVSWAVENKAVNCTSGPVIRANTPAISGYGYFVNIDNSFLPQNRNIEIHKGYFLGSPISTLQSNVVISGGISGSWYEYKTDFHVTGGNLHIEVFSNEGVKDSPSWTSRLEFIDTNPYATGYTGFLYKTNLQNYVQRVAGTTVSGILDNTVGLSAKFADVTCVAYSQEADQFIITDAGNSRIRHMGPRYPYPVVTGVTGVASTRSMCALSGFMWVKASSTVYKYDTVTKGITAVQTLAPTHAIGSDICTDGVDLYMTNGNEDGRILKMIASDPYTVITVAGQTWSGGYSDIDGTGTAAVLRQPCGITYNNGSFYFVAYFNGKLRKMVKSSSVVTTIAGNSGDTNDRLAGSGALGYFYGPKSITDIGGNRFLIGGEDCNIIIYDIGTTMVSKLSGDLNINNTDGADLSASYGVLYHSKRDNLPAYDNCAYFPAYGATYGAGYAIWRHPIDFQSEVVFGTGSLAVTGLSGTAAGTGRSAKIWNAYRGMRYCDGYLYYADELDSVLYKINVDTWESTLVAGLPGTPGYTDNANGLSARFDHPRGITIYGGFVYIMEHEHLRKYNMSTSEVSTVWTRSGMFGISVVVTGTYIFGAWDDAAIYRVGMDGGSQTKVAGNGTINILDHTTGTSAAVVWPAFSNNSYNSTTNTLYFGDWASIRTIVLSGNYPVTTVAGSYGYPGTAGYTDATGLSARFGYPEDLVLDSDKVNLYVCDTYNHLTRKVALADYSVTTFTIGGNTYGYDTTGQLSAGWRNVTNLHYPHAITIGGNHLYINQYGNIIKVIIDDSGPDINVDYIKIKDLNGNYITYESFDGYPLASTYSLAFIHGVDLYGISSNTAAYVYPMVPITTTTMAGITAYQPAEIPIVDTLAFVWGMQDITTNSLAYAYGALLINTATAAYVDGIYDITTHTSARVVGYESMTPVSTPAYVYGSVLFNISTPAFVHGWDTKSISTKAYIDTATSITIGVNAYVWPIQMEHRISVKAFMNTEAFTDSYGVTGFSVYGDVVLSDINYNRVATLMCDYYNYPSTDSIVYNLFLVNGTRYKTSNVMIVTDSTWSNRVTIRHGVDTQYLTDYYDTSAIFPGPIDPDCVMPITLTVISPSVSGATIIPLYITH